jgi:hypothetical protein
MWRHTMAREKTVTWLENYQIAMYIWEISDMILTQYM